VVNQWGSAGTTFSVLKALHAVPAPGRHGDVEGWKMTDRNIALGNMFTELLNIFPSAAT